MKYIKTYKDVHSQNKPTKLDLFFDVLVVIGIFALFFIILFI